MTPTKKNTLDINIEASQFKNSIRNELILHYKHALRPGMWEYKGKWYYDKAELYVVILAHEAAEQFGIKDVAALIAVLSGRPYIPTRAKFGGATPKTSVASKYLSKIPGKSPIRLPMLTGDPKIFGGKGVRIAFTKVIGRFIGRAIPIVGWGVLAYDLSLVFYNTQIEFNLITSDETW